MEYALSNGRTCALIGDLVEELFKKRWGVNSGGQEMVRFLNIGAFTGMGVSV